jgi:hypothetical protein
MKGLVELITYLKENLKKEKNGANLEGGSGDSGDYHVRR